MTKAQRDEHYRNWIAHKHLSAEQKAQNCRHLRDKGYSVGAIAWWFGISKARVRALLAMG